MNTILKVRLGEYDVSTTAEPLKHEEFNISDIVIHPGFNNSTLVHDIALLRLEKPAKRKQVIDFGSSQKQSILSTYTKAIKREVVTKLFSSIFVHSFSQFGGVLF